MVAKNSSLSRREASASPRAAVSNASSRSRSCPALRRSLTSRKTIITPSTLPPGSLVSAPWASTGMPLPSFVSRTVSSEGVTAPPRLMIEKAPSAGSPAPARRRLNTTSSGLPAASSVVHPVRASTVGLMKLIEPLQSVALTASPMLESVMRSHSLCRSSRPSALRRELANQTTLANRSVRLKMMMTEASVCGGWPK